MNLNIAGWIASRYLWSKHAGRFAPLLKITAIASIAIGTMALIIIMSVMRGFKQELSDRLLGLNAHLTLSQQHDARALTWEEVANLLQGFGVRDIAPFVQGEVIAQSMTGGELTAQGARVRGVDPAHLGAVQQVSFYVGEDVDPVEGLLHAISHGGAIVGNEIVAQLMVHPDFGDEVELIAPLAEVGPTGELMPNRAHVEVRGVFRSGIFDYDSKYILLSLDDAKALLGEQASSGWQIRFAHATDAPKAMAAIAERLPKGWRASSIDSENKKLFAALALERLAMGAILIMVLLIASCAIVGVVLLITAAKRKDMAILKSLGVDRASLRALFLLDAAFLGALGSGIGLCFGGITCLAIDRWPIRLPDSYYLDYLPVKLDPYMAALFALMGVVIAIAASWYPVHHATKLDPVEVLRYE